jgi:hypothetical protein
MGYRAGGSGGGRQRQLVKIMTDKNREPDWSAWNNWCDSRIDARRCFDREVLVGVIAELRAMIEGQDEKLKVQAESIHSLELKQSELVRANDLRSAEDRCTAAKLAEYQIAITELRRMINADQAKVIDLSDPLQRREIN